MVNRLLILNGIAIINVILFHATGFAFTAMFSWAHRYRPVASPNYDAIGSVSYYALRGLEQYVMAGRRQGGVAVAGPALARVRALAVPYLLWSTVFLAALALEGRVYRVERYVWAFLTGATHPNYYYVPLLMQLYLLAPIVVRLARRQWRALLAATALLQLAVYLLQYLVVSGGDHWLATSVGPLFPKWLFAAHLFWFTLGVVVGFEQQAFKAFVQRWRWPLAGAAAALFVAGFVEWEWLLHLAGTPWTESRATLIDGLYAGAVILAFLGFAGTPVPLSSTLVDLGTKSFGIYLVHGIAMEYTARGAYHLTPWLLGQTPLFTALVVAVGLAAPLVLMALVKRSPARSAYPYIFG